MLQRKLSAELRIVAKRSPIYAWDFSVRLFEELHELAESFLDRKNRRRHFFQRGPDFQFKRAFERAELLFKAFAKLLIVPALETMLSRFTMRCVCKFHFYGPSV